VCVALQAGLFDDTRKNNVHTLMAMVGGMVLLGVFLLFGRLWGADAAALALAAKVFIPVWLALAVANLWVGVSFTGYSLRDELPILLIVFLVPVAVAALAIWYFSRS
jgi:hypothetical protein